MTNEIQHATAYTAWRKPVPRRGILQIAPGQGVMGYGSKISTDYMLRFNDDPRRRQYRVYCACHSNVGVLYVIRHQQRLYVREHELEDALDGDRTTSQTDG